MAISITTLGNYSFTLTYGNDTGDTRTAILTALYDELTREGNLYGWTIDNSQIADGYLICSNLCVPDRTGARTVSKYVKLDMSTGGYLKIITAADALFTTVAYYSTENIYAQRVNIGEGADHGGWVSFYVHPSTEEIADVWTGGWFVAYSKLDNINDYTGYGNTNAHAFCGCFEVSRDNYQDIEALGIPPIIWLSTANILCFIKLRSGATGQQAVTGSCLGCNFYLKGSGFNFDSPKGLNLNAWNNNTVFSSDSFVGYVTSVNDTELRGRIYGLKIGQGDSSGAVGTYAPNDKISCQCETNTYWSKTTGGTMKIHRILAENFLTGTFSARWYLPE
jgi:hypothetical protein